jgi:hypothetical protein
MNQIFSLLVWEMLDVSSCGTFSGFNHDLWISLANSATNHL